jgi:hypothetical protein
MSGNWKPVKGAEVRAGDRIRMANGTELTATRVEPGMFGNDNLIAFIEDTPERWFKQPAPADADVELWTEG